MPQEPAVGWWGVTRGNGLSYIHHVGDGCYAQHGGGCEPEEEIQEMFTAGETGNYAELAKLLIDRRQIVVLNAERKMLHVMGCGGRIAAQMIVDTELLLSAAESEQALRETSFPAFLAGLARRR